MGKLPDISLDKLDVDHPHPEQRSGVDIDPVDSGAEVKRCSSDRNVFSVVDEVAAGNEDCSHERVARLQTATVVDRYVQLPCHWSGKHNGAGPGRNNRITGQSVVLDAAVARSVDVSGRPERVENRRRRRWPKKSLGCR